MYAAKLERLGVNVESITENFAKGASGRFGRTNALAAHEYISDINSDNALRGMIENVRQSFVNDKLLYSYRPVERERRVDERRPLGENGAETGLGFLWIPVVQKAEPIVQCLLR